MRSTLAIARLTISHSVIACSASVAKQKRLPFYGLALFGTSGLASGGLGESHGPREYTTVCVLPGQVSVIDMRGKKERVASLREGAP
jgi:hypothetical protein